MKKLFVHHPLFRLLSPLFSGILVYLLLLLINNNIGQLQEAFLGEELYVCIGLAYLIQEFSRLSLLFFERVATPKSFFLRIIFQVVVAVLGTVVIVTLGMYVYFTYVLSYTPNIRELYVFNSIFVFIALSYVILYLAHYFLYKINTEKIAREVAAKSAIEEDFVQFRKGINPELLYQSLEAMLVLMNSDVEAAEQFSDHFSTVYRYILSKHKHELVPLTDELHVLNELVRLVNHLPYRRLALTTTIDSGFWVLPTSLLTLIETILRSTIATEEQTLVISIEEQERHLRLSYEPQERLNFQLKAATIKDVCNSYTYYSDIPVKVYQNGKQKIIDLPKLNYHERSNH